MFRFDFLEQEQDKKEFNDTQSQQKIDQPNANDQFRELEFDVLVARLPNEICYSHATIPLSSGANINLPRRELFDARLQVISQDSDDGFDVGDSSNSQSMELDQEDIFSFVEAPSDLLPGVYEGGLKTWECSLDLIGYMKEREFDATWFDGKRILELGCGTALPTVYILQQIFNAPIGSRTEQVSIHLQDYNPSVLCLVTFPNVLLAWYFSEASHSYRQHTSQDTSGSVDDSGDLALDVQLISAFKASLDQYKICIQFFSGAWSQFEPCQVTYDLLLTSETIYRTSSVPSLISVLARNYTRVPEAQEGSSKLLPSGSDSSKPTLKRCLPLTLVAAKVLYFGVGGGIEEFAEAVRTGAGRVETVWEIKTGVGRRILQVWFDQVPIQVSPP